MPELARLSVYTLAAALLAAVALPAPASAEVFFDVGAHVTRFETDVPEGPKLAARGGSAHLGIGVRRMLARGNDIGIRLEVAKVDSNPYLALRVIDYRINLSERFGLGVFFGAARLDTGDAAYGWYAGAGAHFKKVLPAWDLAIDVSFGDSLQRDSVLPTDPPISGPRPDFFYDTASLSIYLSRGFGSRSSERDR
jgi:hypothetical protein